MKEYIAKIVAGTIADGIGMSDRQFELHVRRISRKFNVTLANAAVELDKQYTEALGFTYKLEDGEMLKELYNERSAV